MKRTDTEILLDLLDSLKSLDNYSTEEAVANLSKKIWDAVEEVGDDRIWARVRERVRAQKWDKGVREVQDALQKKYEKI